MDLTTATLQELKARLAELPPGDEFNRISNRIAELELEERSKAAEQETVTNEVAKFMDSLDFEGVDPKDLFVNYTEEKAAASYGYVNAVIQSAVAKMKQAELANTNTLEATIAALQEKYNQSEAANEQLNLELSNKTLEIADLNSRLTNATRMLGEEQAEVERLNSQVDDLRKEIAIGAAAASKVVEVDVRSTREIWEEERRKEEEAKPIIYNIRWKDDIRRDTYLAELAATDETIEIPYYAMNGDMKNAPTAMKGRYRVVASEEAPSFRTAAVVEEDHTSNVPVGSDLTLTVPAFRDDEDESPTEPGLAAEASTVAGSPVTREEFEELKARVDQIASIRSVA
jgi:hypothetical protein